VRDEEDEPLLLLFFPPPRLLDVEEVPEEVEGGCGCGCACVCVEGRGWVRFIDSDTGWMGCGEGAAKNTGAAGVLVDAAGITCIATQMCAHTHGILTFIDSQT